jgi:hypothetical protein
MNPVLEGVIIGLCALALVILTLVAIKIYQKIVGD